MVIGFVIWSIVAGIFLCIGVSSWKSKVSVGFYTFAKKPNVKDIKKYNRAVSVLWFVVAAVLEVVGIPIVFLEQNSPLFVLLILVVVILVLAMMALMQGLKQSIGFRSNNAYLDEIIGYI